MKWIRDLLLFMIFVNIAAFMIASLHIFPSTLYGDTTTYDLDDPENLPSPEEMFTRLITNTAGDVARLWGSPVTFTIIMGTIVLIGVGAAIATKTTTLIAIGLFSTVFVIMYSNSKRLFDSIISNLDVSVQYIALMIGLGVLIMFVITVMDYASGQRSASE